MTLPKMSSGDPVHLVVDSTGVKLYGVCEMEGVQARLVQAAHVA
ncbi:hypothetical protein LJR029_002848 [Caballeronia sp. LjRoot29]